MIVELLGTSGWTPSDTRETACVYIREGDRILLLDAGTGMRRLLTDPHLLEGVTRLDICLSHFHLDHIVGLATLPGVDENVERVIWGPGDARYSTPTRDLLARAIGPPLFAVALDDIASVQELPIGTFEVGPFALRVRTQDLHTHPSVAFRVGDEIVYCTDTGLDPANVEFSEGCRHLLHEAFYWRDKIDDTHCTATDAGTIARDAGVGQLTLIHLDPRLPDEDRLLAEAVGLFEQTTIGRDGASLD